MSLHFHDFLWIPNVHIMHYFFSFRSLWKTKSNSTNLKNSGAHWFFKTEFTIENAMTLPDVSFRHTVGRICYKFLKNSLIKTFLKIVICCSFKLWMYVCMITARSHSRKFQGLFSGVLVWPSCWKLISDHFPSLGMREIFFFCISHWIRSFEAKKNLFWAFYQKNT